MSQIPKFYHIQLLDSNVLTNSKYTDFFLFSQILRDLTMELVEFIIVTLDAYPGQESQRRELDDSHLIQEQIHESLQDHLLICAPLFNCVLYFLQ